MGFCGTRFTSGGDSQSSRIWVISREWSVWWWLPWVFSRLGLENNKPCLKKKAPTGTCTYKWKQNSRQIFRHGAYGIDTVDICLIKEMCQTMAFDTDYLWDVDLILSASDTYELLCPYLGNVMQETMSLTIPTESKPLDPIAGFVKYYILPFA